MTTFIPSLLLPLLPLIITNLISFSMSLFVCFWSIIDLQHYVSSGCTVQWFNISIHFKMIATINLLSVIIQIYYIFIDYIPHTVYFIPMTHLFCNWKFVPLNLPHLFLSSPHLFPLWKPPVCSLYIWLCFVMSLHLFCYLDSTIWVKSYGIFLSLSHLFHLT